MYAGVTRPAQHHASVQIRFGEMALEVLSSMELLWNQMVKGQPPGLAAAHAGLT
jgi:hypothetical protein